MKYYKTNIDKYTLVRESQADIKRAQIKCSSDSAEYLRALYDEDISVREHFYVLFLNRRNNTVGYQHISSGGIDGTVVDIRLVTKGALDCLAVGAIVCHNHPSGNTRPSNSDKDLTQKLKKGLKTMDINLLDHIILTEDDYYSFADNDLI